MKFNARATAAAGVAAMIASGLVVGTPSASHASSHVEVTNTNDSGKGSLRAAIDIANDARLGVDLIVFDIALPGPQLIAPASDLPDITAPVTIDGYSQPGAVRATNTNAAQLLIVLDASSMSEGLQISTNASRIQGLVIRDAVNGGTGGGDGIRVDGNGNRITGNYIGVLVDGVTAAGNEGYGVSARGKGNLIGGSGPANRNLIAANGEGGIFLFGPSNTVSGNYVGTDETGSVDLGNGRDGVIVEGADNVIGGTSPSAGNVISGNESHGIRVDDASVGITVQNNLIGTSAGGDLPLGNSDSGVDVEADDGDLVSNVISANGAAGVEGSGNNVRLFKNRVGVNAVGDAALGNAIGVDLRGEDVVIGNKDQGNQVSGNAGPGIYLFGNRPVVEGNLVGTDVSGALPLGNGGVGVEVNGDDAIVKANRVADSGGDGIFSTSDNALIQGNAVGGLGLGNSGFGIHGDSGPSLTVDNTVSRNLSGGISVTGPEGQQISRNRITQNVGLGIDLEGDGLVEVNDALDVDPGPNDLLNYPVITSASVVAGEVSVSWLLIGALPATAFTLEFFTSPACNPAAPNGEGARFLGSLPATTNPAGFASGGGVLGAAGAGQFVTATATENSTGSTSEFSVCLLVV